MSKKSITTILAVLAAIILVYCVINGRQCRKSEMVQSDMESRIEVRDDSLKTKLKADKIIGYWSFSQASLYGVIAIYEKDGQCMAKIAFSDQSVHLETLEKVSDGIYYVTENGHHNRTDDYYVVNGKKLIVCDRDGDIGWKTSSIQ